MKTFLGVGNTERAAGLGKRMRREVLGVLRVGLWRDVQLGTQMDGDGQGDPAAAERGRLKQWEKS